MKKIISITPDWIKKTYWVPFLLSKIREYNAKKRIYTQTTPSRPKHMVVYCITDDSNRAGMSDRLWGMISTYIACKKNNLTFKALWTHPFDIKNFLIPNKYDWDVDAEDLVYDKRYANPLYVSNNHNEKNQLRLLNRMSKFRTPQIHVYTVAHMERDKFGQYFNYLFKPSQRLKDALDIEKDNIGDKYISITFRFQQLLGDFKEGNYKVLPKEESKKLLEKAIHTIERLKAEHPEYNKILVTSDSKTLLTETRKLPYVYVSNGEVVHMGYSKKGEDIEKHLKSFVDFFMIANAEKVYFAHSSLIYPSTFAHTASCVYNRPYEQIEIR